MRLRSRCSRTQSWRKLILLIGINICFVGIILFSQSVDLSSHSMWQASHEASRSESRTQSNLKIPFHEFAPDQPKSVVILAYQRCGSTFFGQLFNQNPAAFYIYEPLDALYASMYGVSHGWTAPSDITTYWNGTRRTVSDNEIQKQSKFLKHILACEFNLMPTDFLVHDFWLKFSAEFVESSAYIKCLNKLKISRSNRKCRAYNPLYCGKRFGEKPEEQLSVCNGLLTNSTYQPASVPVKTREMYANYRSCMKGIRNTVFRNCLLLLAKSCYGDKIRATKTVRATMASMEALLEKMPNFRVIHLVRDPRGVVMSRKDRGYKSIASKYSQTKSNFMTTEAEIYCRTVVDDIKIRQRLEKQYPGRIYPVFYEDVVENLQRSAENVYSFLNITINSNMQTWLNRKHLIRGQNSTAIASSWARKLTVEENSDIINVCKELFELLRYKWHT